MGVWDAEAASDSTVATVLLAIDVTPHGLEIRLVDYHPKDLDSVQDLSWDGKPILIDPKCGGGRGVGRPGARSAVLHRPPAPGRRRLS